MFVPLLFANSLAAQKLGPEFTVTDQDDHIFFAKLERAQDIDAKGDEFDIGGEITFADDIAIELEMFAQPAALLLFVAKKLADRKPLERFLELALVRRDHAGESRRQLGTQSHFTLAFVGEIEKLIDDFAAAFFAVKIGRLENRPVPFDEAVASGHFAPAAEDVVPHGAISRQKITETRERLRHFKNRSRADPRNKVALE